MCIFPSPIEIPQSPLKGKYYQTSLREGGGVGGMGGGDGFRCLGGDGHGGAPEGPNDELKLYIEGLRDPMTSSTFKSEASCAESTTPASATSPTPVFMTPAHKCMCVSMWNPA